MKQLEVQIMGQSYLLGCPENGDARMLDAVNRVDLAMCKIRDAGKIKARDRIAVLAALNLAFELPERTAAAATIATPTAATNLPPATATATVDETTASDVNAHPEFAALLERLDAVLGMDGQLL